MKLESYKDGTVAFRNDDGKFHRKDGPAVVWENGDQEWYFNGKLHREDGPAVIEANGDQEWYLNDKLHREDGPAIVCANGDKEWWLNGIQMSEQEHAQGTSEALLGFQA